MTGSDGNYMVEMTQNRRKKKLSHSNALYGRSLNTALHKVCCRFFSKGPEKLHENWHDYLQQITLYI